MDDRLAGFLILGSVVLVFTGGEALYADMGHFGRCTSSAAAGRPTFQASQR